MPFAIALVQAFLAQGTRHDDFGMRPAGQALKRPSQGISVPPYRDDDAHEAFFIHTRDRDDVQEETGE